MRPWPHAAANAPASSTGPSPSPRSGSGSIHAGWTAREGSRRGRRCLGSLGGGLEDGADKPATHAPRRSPSAHAHHQPRPGGKPRGGVPSSSAPWAVVSRPIPEYGLPGRLRHARLHAWLGIQHRQDTRGGRTRLAHPEQDPLLCLGGQQAHPLARDGSPPRRYDSTWIAPNVMHMSHKYAA